MADTSSETMEDLMNNFHAAIGKEALKEIMSKFNEEESIHDMFRALWSVQEAHTYLTPKLVFSEKSDEESNRLRGLGNDFLIKRDLKQALETFTQSIMVASHPDIMSSEHRSGKTFETLSLCYARRSAALFELQLYDLCLLDIERANGCPKLQHELNERQKQCLALLKNSSKNQSSNSLEDIASIPKLVEPSSIIPCISSSCKIAYMQEKGRHVIASKRINPGDVILAEKAYCSCLSLDRLATHCSTCLRECLAPLPCPYCTMVVFCSSKCQLEGLSRFHWLECNMLPTMCSLNMTASFSNSFKILERKSCSEWRTILQRLDDRNAKYSPEKKGVNEKEIFSSEDFDLFYSQVTNVEERPSGDLYVKCLIAFVLLKLLQLGGRLFRDEKGQALNPPEEDALFIGQFLFSNLMKNSCNGFGITDFQCTISPFHIDKENIGSAIYPTFSLINHSCNPSGLPYFYGRYAVLRAARTLQEGEEITIGYCRGSYMQPLENRQIYLNNVYQFECACEACEENWPSYGELPSELHVKCVLCSQAVSEKTLKCPDCAFEYTGEGNNEDERKTIRAWKEAYAEAKMANDSIQNITKALLAGTLKVKPDFEVIRKAVEILEKHIPPPSPLLWDARDTLELYFHLEDSQKAT
ncbi:SET and MYND domain-containing protein 4-like [Macrobrachium rosenbergii]|uniref:SET and MYND domain-containing protein 4-like n=1 Tax=Macrobrachium rosenbergii TaxID=79674 RepID=UPI0034D5F9AD